MTSLSLLHEHHDPDAPQRRATGDLPGTPGTGATERISSLERQLRTLKWCLLAIVLVAVADGLHRVIPGAGVAAAQAGGSAAPVALRDADGNLRASFGLFSGVPVVELYDDAGNARLSMGLKFDGTPFLDLADENGATRASIGTNGDGSGTLRLQDAHGDVRARFGG